MIRAGVWRSPSTVRRRFVVAEDSARRSLPWGTGRRLVVAVVVGLLAAFLFSYLVYEISTITSDLEVYRGAIQTLLAGGDLYGFEVETKGLVLPFTYPPFAAIVLMPLALGDQTVVTWVWAVCQCAMLALAVWLVFRETPRRERAGTLEGRLLLALGFVLMLGTDPVISGITLGQVSLGLVVLVLVDFLVVPPRWRGLLTGLAAAVKLTPLVFVAYLLVTRQWRAAANAMAAALAATAIGFVVLPSQSVRYWTELLWRTDRVGETAAVRNKSLLGVLNHFGVDAGLQRPIWLVLVVLVVALVLWSARRQHLAGNEFGAVVSVGLLAALISPIAWPHHLVWLPLAGLYLCWLGRRLPLVAGIGVLASCWLWSPLLSYMASGQPWLDVLGDGVVLVALAVAIIGLPRATGAMTPTTGPERPTSRG